MKNLFYILTLLFSFSSFALANKCELSLEANGMMQYSTDKITIESDCAKFKINLKNTGTLDVALAGHNIVISKKSDFDSLTATVDPSIGIDEGYLPKSEKVIYKTKFLGPDESTTLVIDTAKLKSGEEYIFWCSFLGHWGVMNGKLVVN
tara:strand:+ start:32 stop:478 length:447 start_codon:yes stop_codon:yes gene_type:complete